MIHDSRARSRAAKLLKESALEVEALGEHVVTLRRYRQTLEEDPSDPVSAVVAVALHAYYTAAEAFFERVASNLDGDMPRGDDSHTKLLRLMLVDVPQLRPAVVPDDLLNPLKELLDFRHFFRHAYRVKLDAAKLAKNADIALGCHDRLVGALERFRQVVKDALEALPPP